MPKVVRGRGGARNGGSRGRQPHDHQVHVSAEEPKARVVAVDRAVQPPMCLKLVLKNEKGRWTPEEAKEKAEGENGYTIYTWWDATPQELFHLMPSSSSALVQRRDVFLVTEKSLRRLKPDSKAFVEYGVIPGDLLVLETLVEEEKKEAETEGKTALAEESNEKDVKGNGEGEASPANEPAAPAEAKEDDSSKKDEEKPTDN